MPASKNESLTVKRALFWHSLLFLIGGCSSLSLLFLLHIANIQTLNIHNFPVFSIALLIGGLIAFIKVKMVLLPQIHDGMIQEVHGKVKTLTRIFTVLQLGFVLCSRYFSALICQFFSNTNLSTCSSSIVITSGFFFGTFLLEFLWILIWEHRHKAKLYM